MAIGILLQNQSGSVLVDNTYWNYALASKQVLSFSTASSLGYFTPITLTYSSSNVPIVAVSCTSAYIGVISKTTSGTTHTWTFTTPLGSASQAGFSFTAYIFDQPPTPTMSGLSMVVFDSSGNPLFDARLQYMRVVGVYATAAWTGSSFPTLSQSLSSGPTYAVIVSAPRGGLDSIGTGLALYQIIDGALVSSSAVYVACTSVSLMQSNGGGSAGITALNTVAGSALVIDVTSY